MKTILVSLIVAILSIPISSNAQSTLALQEKCAEAGERFFLERINLYGGSRGSFSDEKGHGYNDFTTHYSKKFDKCFIRIEYSYFPKNKDEKSIKTLEVYDALGGKRFAGWSLCMFCPIDCKVGDKTCNSLSEFETLIKPYMKDNGEGLGGDWKYFGTGDRGTFWWYDTQRETHHPNRTIRVWVKKIKAEEIEGMVKGGAKLTVSELEQMTSERNYEQSLIEIDCVERTINVLQELSYDSEGILKGGESKYGAKKSIPTDSVAERLYEIVCK